MTATSVLKWRTPTPTARKRSIFFPYACCEIGAGMMSSYIRRIKIGPDDIAAMALIKIGSGSNMQGYYMYHGGNNPNSSLSSLNEQKPNPMPFKDYDFQAPLGAGGEVREHYYLLREQHLFLQDFGPALARTQPFFSGRAPAEPGRLRHPSLGRALGWRRWFSFFQQPASLPCRCPIILPFNSR